MAKAIAGESRTRGGVVIQVAEADAPKFVESGVSSGRIAAAWRGVRRSISCRCVRSLF